MELIKFLFSDIVSEKNGILSKSSNPLESIFPCFILSAKSDEFESFLELPFYTFKFIG